MTFAIYNHPYLGFVLSAAELTRASINAVTHANQSLRAQKCCR